MGGLKNRKVLKLILILCRRKKRVMKITLFFLQQQHLKHNERGAGRKKALSEDQIAEFEELLLQGAGEKQLRERFGISRSSYFLYKKRLAEKQ